jgi:hypothetical protein
LPAVDRLFDQRDQRRFDVRRVMRTPIRGRGDTLVDSHNMRAHASIVKKKHRHWGPSMRAQKLGSNAIRIAAIAFLVVSGTSLAQGSRDRDAQEVSAYRLTDAALAKFVKATHNLAALPAGSIQQCSDDDGAQSLDALVARIDAVPAASNAIRSSGMATREYAVFTFSVFQAGMAAWALDQPGAKAPAHVSTDNIAFYRKHEAELKALEREADLQCADDERD